MPDQDVVVAITSGVPDMQGMLNVIWDRLLPVCEASRLPTNQTSHQSLRDRLSSLEVTPAPGANSSSLTARFLNKRFVFAENDQKIESIALNSTDGGANVTLAIERGGLSMNIPAGYRQWRTGRSPFPVGRLAQFKDEPVAGTFAWKTEDTAVIKACAYETPFHLKFDLKFTEESVTLDSEVNVAFGPTKHGTLVGRSEFHVAKRGTDEAAEPAGSPATKTSTDGVPISIDSREVIRLYDGPAPGSEGWTHSEKEIAMTSWGGPVVSNVVHPTLTVIRPDRAKANGTAVVICPGGGFFMLSINSEGMDVAHALAEKGVTGFVLRYRLVETKTDNPARELMSRGDINPIVQPILPLAMADGQAAVSHVRRHAAEYGIRSNRVGIMGFSAGGTVASSVGFNYTSESRPDFVAPIYLAYSWTLKDKGVPSDAPPMFILAATDDQLGLASHSVDLYRDWTAAKKPAELHLFAKGGHGFGMNTQKLPTDGWIHRFVDWLDYQGLLEK
jgi:acetyl esterase/lipase